MIQMGIDGLLLRDRALRVPRHECQFAIELAGHARSPSPACQACRGQSGVGIQSEPQSRGAVPTRRRNRGINRSRTRPLSLRFREPLWDWVLIAR